MMPRWFGSTGCVVAVVVAIAFVSGCGRPATDASLRRIEGDGWMVWYRASGGELVLRLDHEGVLGKLRVYGDGRTLALRYDRLGDTYSSIRLNEYELRLAQDTVDGLVRQIMDSRRDEWFPGAPGMNRDYGPVRVPRILFRFARISRGDRQREGFERWVAPTAELRKTLDEIIESEEARLVQQPPPPTRPLWLGRLASEAPRLLVEHGSFSLRRFSVVDRLGLKQVSPFAERMERGPPAVAGQSRMLTRQSNRPYRPRTWSFGPCCCALQWPEIDQAGPLDRDEVEATSRRVLQRARPCVSEDGAFIARSSETPGKFSVEAHGRALAAEVIGYPIGWAARGPVLYYRRRPEYYVSEVRAMSPGGPQRPVLVTHAFLLSPHGRRAAYISGRDRHPARAREDRCLWTMDLAHDGFPQPGIPGRRIACGVSSFDWSPDGRELVYAWANRDEWVRRLSRRSVDGRPPRTLYEVESGGWFPVLPNWSPDGAVVGFVRRWSNTVGMGPIRIWTDTPSPETVLRARVHKSSVWVVGADGSDPIEITEAWAVRWLGERRGPWP